MLRLFSKKPQPNPARELARMGVEKRKRAIREVAQQIRRECGLPEDPRLA